MDLNFEDLMGELPTEGSVKSSVLRKQTPTKLSSSITPNVMATHTVSTADKSAYPYQESPDQPPTTPQSAVSALRGPQVARAQEGLSRDTTELERLTAPPDYSKMQEYAKQRSSEGQSQLLVALAAQEAGKEFAPLGGEYLKRAMAARDPLKTATGIITGTGEVVDDPMAKQEQQLKVVQARISRNEQIISSAATAEEKARADAENRELRKLQMQSQEQMKQMQLQMQREAMMAREQARIDRASDRQHDTNEKRTDTIRREYNARLQKVQDGSNFANQVVTALSDPSIAKNAPAQIALVMQFGKMLDPDSVVREAEQQMIAGARGLSDALTQLIPKLQTGQFLTPTQLQQMNQVALQYQQGSNARVNDLKELYTGLAQRNGLPAQDIVLGMGSSGLASPPPGAVRPAGTVTPPSAMPATPGPSGGPPPGAVRPR